VEALLASGRPLVHSVHSNLDAGINELISSEPWRELREAQKKCGKR
jgi:hypothetical protein